MVAALDLTGKKAQARTGTWVQKQDPEQGRRGCPHPGVPMGCLALKFYASTPGTPGAPDLLGRQLAVGTGTCCHIITARQTLETPSFSLGLGRGSQEASSKRLK